MDTALDLRRQAVWNELRLSLERWTFIIEHPDDSSASEVASLRHKILGLEAELAALSGADR